MAYIRKTRQSTVSFFFLFFSKLAFLPSFLTWPVNVSYATLSLTKTEWGPRKTLKHPMSNA